MASAAAKKLKVEQKSVLARHLPKAGPDAKALRLVKNRVPSKEVAAERVYAFLWELGADYEHELGWKIRVIEYCGLEPTTGYQIINGTKDIITSDVVDRIAFKLGIPVGVFYDENV
jgi:hypothetical protein